MKKFSCSCGKNVRDVYYKNGNYMCAKCFWQNTDNPYDYLINMLASRGLVVTFKNEPVLVLKQFSADFLDEKEAMVTPGDGWLVLPGDDFWTYFNGTPENLRGYITDYGIKKNDAENEAAAASHDHSHGHCGESNHDCSTCTSCSHEED